MPEEVHFHQVVDSELQPLAFFSRKLTSSESLTVPTTVNSLLSTRLSDTFGICWKLEISTVFTDHKPLTYAFRQKDSGNIAADVLSRVSAITFPSQIDYDCGLLLRHNRLIQELHTLIASGTSLELKKAQPLKDITAETVAEAFFSSWVSRFGTPAILTTDRGRQFESSLFKALSKLLGVQKCRTTDTTLKLMGMIEELHRPLKSAIKCHATERWTEMQTCLLFLTLRTCNYLKPRMKHLLLEPNATASTPATVESGSNSFNAYPAIYTFWSQSSSSN
ncbi:RT_RNaseH domain-containing protein [Trichonephila clavipes]|nr:RT_RNaseH domain-containing protein [Trichonephila clavipes]